MRATILIVDDDPDMVELLRFAVTQAGYSARTATTGKEALAEAQRFSPDLVVLDLLLPDMNGFNVCDQLRQNPLTASVPVIMITVLPGQLPRLVGVESGVSAYLNKPFSTQELVARIGGLIYDGDAFRDRRSGPLWHRGVRHNETADPWFRKLEPDPVRHLGAE